MHFIVVKGAVDAKDKDKLVKAVKRHARHLKRTGNGQKVLNLVSA